MKVKERKKEAKGQRKLAEMDARKEGRTFLLAFLREEI